MYFLISANITASLTTGMDRQMHGLGHALAQRHHHLEYVFGGALRIRTGRNGSRLESAMRLAAEIRLSGRSTPIRTERSIASFADLHAMEAVSRFS